MGKKRSFGGLRKKWLPRPFPELNGTDLNTLIQDLNFQRTLCHGMDNQTHVDGFSQPHSEELSRLKSFNVPLLHEYILVFLDFLIFRYSVQHCLNS